VPVRTITMKTNATIGQAPSASFTLWQSDSDEPVVARIAIAGDFLPSERLTFPDGESWATIAEHLGGLFSDVDLLFANLESVLDARVVPPLNPRRLSGLGAINCAPATALDYMEAVSRFSTARILSVANNHAYDFADAGIARTRSALAHRNIVSLGHVSSLGVPPDVFLWEGPSEVRVGFWAAALACSEVATKRRAGVEPASRARALESLSLLRSQGAKFCMALVHAGCLRTNRMDPADAARLDSLAQCGFDLVAACHSHRIAGARRIGAAGSPPKFSLYGLGSIVSDCAANTLDREGLVVIAGFDGVGNLLTLEVRPVLLGACGFGEIPSCETADAILNRFQSLSREFEYGTAARRFYEDVSPSLIPLYIRDVKAAFRESGMAGVVRKAKRARVRHLRRLLHGVIP
jgi:Bacterial capsule synthesis protein PGA_cap